MRRDDIVGAARLGRERDLAKLHETAQAVQVKEAELANAQKSLAEARDGEEWRASRLESILAAINPALAGLSATAFAAWMTRRNEALASMQLLREAEREVSQAQFDGDALCAGLRDALAQAVVPFDPAGSADMLAVAAQNGLDREARRQLLLKDVVDCEKHLRTREAALDRASRDDKAWQTAWLAACSGCWLGPASAAAPFETVRAVIAAAAELGPALEKRSDLARRIHDMENDQAAFRHEVNRLVAELGIEPAGRAEPELAKAVSGRVQDAVRAQAERERLLSGLAQAQDKEREVQGAAHTHASRVGEMMRVLQAGSLIEVAGKLRDIQDKADLETQATAVEREILADLNVVTLAEAKALLDGQTIAELEGAEVTLAAHSQDLEQRTRKLFADQQTAIDRIAAVGSDDAAARIDERRRTQLLDIEERHNTTSDYASGLRRRIGRCAPTAISTAAR